MTPTLRLLLVEDSEEDGLLLERELRRAGHSLKLHRVWTKEALSAALADTTWDVVVSDWSLPLMTAIDACKAVRLADPDLPFLIVSGTIDEELAVDALRAGADDFMSKNRLARLRPAIDRALRDRAIRRKERQSTQELDVQRARIVRSERLLRMVLDTVPDGVMVVDRGLKMLECNPAARHMLGISDEETDLAAVYRLWTFMQPGTLTAIEISGSPLSRALRGETVDQYELIGRRTDGLVRHFMVSTRPFDELPAGGGALATIRDVTQERATQEQLMLSDRLASVGMLAAGVAHEINNPLAACLANLDLMRSVVGPEGPIADADLVETREMLEDANSAARRVREIVRDLKIFARHEEGTNNSVDLKPMLESTARMAWNEIRHRAKLVKEYGNTAPVRGSDSRLGQVFLNLLVNAAQAIPEGNATSNEIRIRTGMTKSNMAFVEVSDSGSGMSPETQRQLFTPFFTTKPKGEGTGLGLAIVYRIVRGLGGDVEVESEIGKGTVFRVLLPRAKRTTAEVTPVTEKKAPTRRLRVLAVDDEPMILQTLHRALGRAHDVQTTTRAVEALGWIKDGARYDAILCDLMMPEMTGMDFHAHLVELGQADAMIFMTGGAFTPAAREFLDLVKNTRLEKPFDREQLHAVLATRAS